MEQKQRDMNTNNLVKVNESEKAIQFEVGFKFNENATAIVYGSEGNQKNNTGYIVKCWFPKSAISEDGKIADWATKNVLTAFGGRININDELF